MQLSRAVDQVLELVSTATCPRSSDGLSPRLKEWRASRTAGLIDLAVLVQTPADERRRRPMA